VVVQIERGFITDPRRSTLQALAKALGAGVEDFLRGTEDEPLRESPKQRGKK
jgi:transcriptional regulator with XRE-family HTH domain